MGESSVRQRSAASASGAATAGDAASGDAGTMVGVKGEGAREAAAQHSESVVHPRDMTEEERLELKRIYDFAKNPRGTGMRLSTKLDIFFYSTMLVLMYFVLRHQYKLDLLQLLVEWTR